MQKTWPLLMVLFLLFVATVPDPGDVTPGQDLLFDPINIRVEMASDGITLVIIETRVTNIGNISRSTVELRLESLQITRVSAQVDGEDVDTLVVEVERHSIVVVEVPGGLAPDQSRSLSLEIESGDIQTSFSLASGSQNLRGSLLFYFKPNSRVGNLSMTAVLPVHASLNYESVTPLYPNANQNFTDGESLVFVWFLDELQPGEEKMFLVSYVIPYVPPAQEGLSITAAFIAGLLSGLGILSVVVFRPSLPTRAGDDNDVPFAGLTSEEETILGLIRDKGGSCSQKELYTQLSISESKISLILRNLEERELVRRLRSGRENTVHLVDSK
ncbi:MAG: MarR family transcriptional regulator [Candidatus Thorarchaeota archaeon]|nr:MAG: MarR family transcriptional regulator [Candidatus Thorarchaeota archaeon]